jgi:hypothetical protein
LRNQFLLGRYLVVGILLAATAGCAVRTQTRVPPSLIPPTPQSASADDLIARLNEQSERIQTLTAKVDFAPTAGSVYSGVINEYHDVKGFILYKKPSMIRIIGQAPVVRTNIFDMVSVGDNFRLSIPPKNKFIVGKASAERPAKNPLESMRPQHILDALLVPPVNPDEGHYSFEGTEEGARRYYVLTAFRPGSAHRLYPERKIWFDRSDLHVSRLDLYGPDGVTIETVNYSADHDFDGVSYPTEIKIVRPVEDYSLSISIEKATFNAEIAPDKFELKKPADAELVEIGAVPGPKPGPVWDGAEAADGH